MTILALLALSAGAAIAIQASMNAQLGVLLHSSQLGTSVAFLTSFIFTVITAFVLVRDYPSIDDLKAVPFYLWFSGGLLSAFGVSLFYFLIPKMGIGSMMSYALTGQIVVAVIAGHFGWFDLPLRAINAEKVIGVFALLIGIVLINKNSV